MGPRMLLRPAGLPLRDFHAAKDPPAAAVEQDKNSIKVLPWQEKLPERKRSRRITLNMPIKGKGNHKGFYSH